MTMKRKRALRESSSISAPAPALAVGIDLGTTFSCVSVYRRRKTEIISNKQGDRFIPSVVYFDPKTGEVSVGKKAEALIPQCPGNGITDAKRFIGRQFADESILRYIKSEQKLMSLVNGQRGQVGFQVEISGQKVVKMPEEVIAELLKFLKNMASDYLGNTVTEAVISVPAYSSVAQRKATKNAAELAGIKVLRLVSEPAAAAIQYVSDKKQKNTTVLVFDFGGGTLDVSIIKISDKTIEVKAVNGDTLLGGRNFDELLVNHFQKGFISNSRRIMGEAELLYRLINNCVTLKEKVSVKEHGRDHFSLSITRKMFEELAKDIFQRCLDLVKLCLMDARLSKSDIDEVLLVGGSTRIPKIRELLKIYFKDKPINLDLNPDEAVTAGASIQAAFLKGRSRELEKYSLTEVTPLSLGIETKDKHMEVLIKKHSSLPKTETRDLVTSINDQSEMAINIFEGERLHTSYNNQLAEAMIVDLPPNRVGEVAVKLSFELDYDGLLTVQAAEKLTGNTLKINISQFTLSEKIIERNLKQYKKNARIDDLFQKFNLERNQCDKRFYEILYEIDKISPTADRYLIDKTCHDFLHFTEHLHFTKINALKEKFDNMMKSINGILKNNQMENLQIIPLSPICYYSLRSRNVAYQLP